MSFNAPTRNSISSKWVVILFLKKFGLELKVDFSGTCSCVSFVTDDEVRNWTSPGYPTPYRANDGGTMDVSVDEEYRILVTVQVLDLDGEHGDYLSITPGICSK